VRLGWYVLAVGGGTLAQSSIVPTFGGAGAVPDLPLVVVVLLGLYRGPEAALGTGFALGLAQDAVGGGMLGIHAFAKALIGFGAGELPRLCLVANPVVPVLATVLATVAEGMLRFGLLQLFHYPASLADLLVRVILPVAVLNGVLAACALTLPILRLRW
jgi:rod shape-determining protein MreD